MNKPKNILLLENLLNAKFEKVSMARIKKITTSFDDKNIYLYSTNASNLVDGLCIAKADLNIIPEFFTDFIHLISLNLQMNKITDLSPLAGLTELQDLNLWINKISDLSPLAGLKRLQDLNLSNNKISDISPLTDLTGLQNLLFFGNEITNLSPIAGLTGLKDLHIAYNQITDISPLAGLTGLQNLYLTKNQINDILPLAGLTGLQDLSLFSNPISDISALASLTELKKIIFGHDKITDISPLSGLISLEVLEFSECPINDISPLAGLKELKSLHLDGNHISDLTPLVGVTGLKKLSINRTKVTDFSLLGKLTELQDLGLVGNNIKDISPISGLTKLKTLNFSYNQITDLSPVAGLKGLYELSSSNNPITNLSPLAGLTGLKRLSVTKTQISDLSPLACLIGLQDLNLSNGSITDISPLAGLTGLLSLWLTNNQITDISPLASLTRLQSLWLSDNKISHIEPWICDFSTMKIFWSLPGGVNPGGVILKNNPIETPPIEVIKLGNRAMQDWFEQLKKEKPLYNFEVKLMLIGEGGTGKTSLIRKLKDINSPLPEEKDTTPGIEIQKWKFPINKKLFNHLPQLEQDSILVNIWDFGGQKIYHGTHQMFFGKDTYYILVEETREHKTDFSYWFNTIEQLAGENANLHIVTNQKFGHTFKFDESGFKSRFNFIKDISDLDLSLSDDKIVKLQEDIKHALQNLSQIGQKLPASYVRVKEKLYNLKENFISFDLFREICKENELTDSDSIILISRYLHETGIITHFIYDEVLKHRVFLNSAWLVKTIYKVLDNKTIKEKKGRITGDDVKQIWNKEDLDFETGNLVRLMNNFGLMYKVRSKDEYVIPAHLPTEKPYDNWEHKDNAEMLIFKYEFGKYMPEGLMSHLIVSLHNYIENELKVWHRGLNIYRENTFAEIIETYGETNTFEIKITGSQKREMLAIIRQSFKEIIEPFKKLNYRELIPCNCVACNESDEPHFYIYENLLKRHERNIRMVQCETSYEDINVKSLLEGVFLEENKEAKLIETEKLKKFDEIDIIQTELENTDSLKIYFSYAWGDEKEQVESREDIVNKLYDSLKIDGFNVIRDKMDLGYRGLISKFMEDIGQGDLIVVVVSDKYVRSPYCMFELYEIARNSKFDKNIFAQRVLPVIVEFIDFSEPKVLKPYLAHWKSKLKDWEDLIKENINGLGKQNMERYDKTKLIQQNFGNLSDWLVDINSLNPTILSKNNFEIIKKEIVNFKK